MNEFPLSDVTVAAELNLLVQHRMKALQQFSAVAAGRGQASSHLVDLSRKYVWTFATYADWGRGIQEANCHAKVYRGILKN